MDVLSHSSKLSVPVVIIIFRRPNLTRQVLEAIAEAKPPRLFVIADGPRPGRPDDLMAVKATRELFDEISWECEVTRIYAEKNLGLRNRVISGLDEVFSQVESAIILEDDCVPSPDFFTFSSELLARYQAEEKVSLISGNNFAPKKNERNSYYFSRHANIWGWATWRRTWNQFRVSKTVAELSHSEQEQILESIPGVSQRASFHKLLKLSEGLDSWAIQFAAFNYLNQLLSAVPSQNLVTNVGFGGESTHTKFESWADEIPLGNLKFPLRHPQSIAPDYAEMRRESSRKTLAWISYPILHPWDTFRRIIKYVRTSSKT